MISLFRAPKRGAMIQIPKRERENENETRNQNEKTSVYSNF
jgi:hypothetical protein